MKPGLVSNCWRHQLDHGASLDSLVARAVNDGVRAVELRQNSLGDYEDRSGVPDSAKLSDLKQQFHQVRFNLAINVPFLDPASNWQFQLESGVAAATAVSGKDPPHLRLVDLSTAGPRLTELTPLDAAKSILEPARRLASSGGILSLEHSIQPWSFFYHAVQTVRAMLKVDAAALLVCFDPCNLLLPGDSIDPVEVTTSLHPDEVSMIHFKQRRAGRILPVVESGDIDWSLVVREIERIGFDCPGLFEIESRAGFWENLQASREYLESLDFSLWPSAPRRDIRITTENETG